MALQSLVFRGAAGLRCFSSSRMRAGCISNRGYHRFIPNPSDDKDSPVSSNGGSHMYVRMSSTRSNMSCGRSPAPNPLQGFSNGGRRHRSRSSGTQARLGRSISLAVLQCQHANKSSTSNDGPLPQRPAGLAGGEKREAHTQTTRRRRKQGRSSKRGVNRGVEYGSNVPVFGLDIPESRVHLVDTLERLEAAGIILEKSVLMSIDTETQPSFKVGEWYPTSLLQIATRDVDGEEHVLVIDLLSLKDGLRLPNDLSAVLRGPFGSPNVIKLGVGITEDLNDMFFAFGKAPFLREVPGVLNLNVLHALAGNSTTRDLSLRKLTSIYLGCSLSKKQQMSRWARRPLRKAQMIYAACDALVALRVFDALLKESGKVNLEKLSSTWIPQKLTEKGLVKEKAARLRRKIAAREKAMGQEHIQYVEKRD